VAKLFHLTQPSIAYVGQKDYQQAVIIQRVVRDLEWPVTIRVLPTVREPDGLAMSSRNRYLSAAQRRQAVVVGRALKLVTARLATGERNTRRLRQAARRLITRESSARIDYVAIVDAETLTPLRRASGRVAVLVAVRLGNTRLIDNVLVDVS